MDKSSFKKKLTHREGRDFPQYYGNDESLLDIFPLNGMLDSELHSHQFFLILWIKKGNGVHSINFKDFPMADNQIFFLSPDDVHNVSNQNENIEGVAIAFRKKLLDFIPTNVAEWILFNVYNSIGKPSIANIDTNTADSLNMWIKALKFLLADQENLYTDSDYSIAATLSVIYNLIKRHASWNKDFIKSDSKEFKTISMFKKSINENLKESHSPAFYSIKIGVAESKLSAITKEICGLSPRKFINKEIILKAKKLLINNSISIKEISDELGFTDAPHFVKFFKKETGLTPGQFKETL